MAGFLLYPRMRCLHPLIVSLLAGTQLPALAARPMITDDARIVDTKACQVESWMRVNREGQNQFWAVPGCTPVEGLELTVGGGHERRDGQTQLADSLAQGKWVLRPFKPNGWGMALTLGRLTERDLSAGGRTPSHYLNLPLSLSRRDDALLLHANLGLRRDRARGKDHTTWGLSAELMVRPGLQVIAETYGESGSRSFLHGGLRHWVVPDRLQVDATYGTESRWGTQQRWVTLGLRWMSPAFLP